MGKLLTALLCLTVINSYFIEGLFLKRKVDHLEEMLKHQSERTVQVAMEERAEALWVGEETVQLCMRQCMRLIIW